LINHIENRQHDEGTEKAVGEDAIELIGKMEAIGSLGLGYDAAFEQGGDEAVAVVSDNRLGIAFQGFLQMVGDRFRKVLQVLGKLGIDFPALGHDLFIGFEVLESGPASRQFRQQTGFRNGCLHLIQHGINIGAIRNMQGRPQRLLLGMLEGDPQKLFLALAAFGHRWDDRHLQAPGEFLGIDLDAPPGRCIDHVERQYQRNAQFEELDSQVEVPFQIGGIHNVDDDCGPVIDEKIPSYQFFQRVSRQGVGAGQVHHPNLMAIQVAEPFLLFHRDAGIVPHMLAGTGDFVEEGGLAAVGIAGQSGQMLRSRTVHGDSSTCTRIWSASLLRRVRIKSRTRIATGSFKGARP